LEFTGGRIKMRYRGADRSFEARLSEYLTRKSGKRWDIEIAPSENQSDSAEAEPRMTVSEAAQAEMKNNPLVADALNLFGDATVVSAS